MEKILALANHLGLEVFQYNDADGINALYVGMTQEDFDSKEEEFLEEFETREEVDTAILEMIDGFELLEDIITVSGCDTNLFEYGSDEYLVVTDDEAYDLWETELDHYLEELIYPELTGNLANYFDDEKWKTDARHDGRAHSLARYDGDENSEDINGVEYFIYRQN